MSMKIKFIITLALVALLSNIVTSDCYSASADAVLTPNVQKLVGFIQDGNHSSAEDVLKSLSNKERDEFIDYVKSHEDEVPPLYYIKLADYVYKSDKDEAALWYYIGKVRSYEDVMMCKDKTSQAQLDIYPLFAPKTLKYISTKVNDKAYLANMLQQTLDWDLAHADRVNPIWACYQGLGAYSKTPELKSEKQQIKILENVREDIQDSIRKYRK